MLEFDTAEYQRLALLAAGVDPSQIPPILDTATWRRMLLAALSSNYAARVFAGSVETYSQLPTTLGSPPIGSTFLVKKSSGVYFINYKDAGVYIKVVDTGSLSDWVYTPLSALQTLPDVTLTNPAIGQTLIWNGTKWINSSLPNYFDVRFQSSDVALNPGYTLLGGSAIPVVVFGKYKVSVHARLTATGGAGTQISVRVFGAGFYDGGLRARLIQANSEPDTGAFSQPWIVSTGNNSGDHIFEYYMTVGLGDSISVQYSSNGATMRAGSNFSITRIVN